MNKSDRFIDMIKFYSYAYNLLQYHQDEHIHQYLITFIVLKQQYLFTVDEVWMHFSSDFLIQGF